MWNCILFNNLFKSITVLVGTLLLFIVDCAESRYLKEDKPHGSAGGLNYFRDMIMEDSPVCNLRLIYLSLFFLFVS